MNTLALIPARGGSKSIPRKNIRPLAGNPLIAYSIAAALEADAVDRVLVSTDDSEIAAIARDLGAEAPFIRPPALAADDTRDLPVLQHAVSWLRDAERWNADVVVHLRPTAPIRPRGLVDEAVRILLEDAALDSVRSVSEPSENPFKMWTADRGRLRPLIDLDMHEAFNAPRQVLPAVWWHSGHVDVMRAATLEEDSVSGHDIAPVFVDPRFAVDIDTELDWSRAESLIVAGGLEMVRPPVARLDRCRLAVFDFDGVMTDDAVYVSEDGTEAVRCERGDGMGIALLREAGVECVVLSTERNKVVAARCSKLGIECQQGLDDKGQALSQLAEEHGVSLEHVLYVGNDRNDAECLRLAGIAVVVGDAHPSVRSLADISLQSPGGRGAVREICDAIVSSRHPRLT